ncbi:MULTISPECIES: hypothetical protein [Acinetobacter]|uniref:hypothetical protein n=1 Tax=Acinetobacter TaxID=469 RepID=UPI000448927E|nr:MULTISPECIES: hypothetical protein [Acinetobacter]EXB47850.1 hypothetical protein J522_1394 [Acinetobacter baumannii 146457]EYT19710.1 hypothetical protein J699_01942 [Acinetobacter sp. 1000160]MCU4639957.1 hypothetical protein [Acinetobacter courvalinii]
MKFMNTFAMIIACGVSFNVCYAKENPSWSDYLQDSTQIKSPVEYIDTYNKYSVISPNFKIKLTDFGNIDKTKKNINYTLKKYGVQVLNGKYVYNVFETTTPLKSNVDFTLLYHDKDIVAFRIKEISTIDYVRVPFKKFQVTTYLYNIKNNNFTEIPVILSNSDEGNEKTDLLMGDQVTYDAKKGQYTYLANIKTYKDEKISPFKITVNVNLKCISSTLGCETTGVLAAEKENK